MANANNLAALIVAFVLGLLGILVSKGRPTVQDGALVFKYPSGLRYLFIIGFLFFAIIPFVLTKTGFGFSVKNVSNESVLTLLGLALAAGLQLFGIYYVNKYEIRIYDDKMTYGMAKKRTIYFRDVSEIKHMVSGVGAVLIVLRNKKRISFTNSISGFYDFERMLKQKVVAIHQNGV